MLMACIVDSCTGSACTFPVTLSDFKAVVNGDRTRKSQRSKSIAEFMAEINFLMSTRLVNY